MFRVAAPIVRRQFSAVAGPTVVAAGKVVWIPAGQIGMWTAPHLTVCTAVLLRVRQNGQLKGWIMSHRQPLDFEHKENLRAIKQSHVNDGDSIEVVSVQTAPDTEAQGANSTDGMGADIQEVLGIDGNIIQSRAEKGVKESFMVNKMTVHIKPNNLEIVDERVGVFQQIRAKFADIIARKL